MKETNENTDQTWKLDIDACNRVLESVRTVLIEKNKRYGNSALVPLNVFYKGDATNSILIRLDDKLSRIKNSSELRKNDLYDLLGYCILYMINYDNCEPFATKLQSILDYSKTHYVNGILHMNKYIGDEQYPRGGYLYNGFSKENYVDTDIIKSLNGVCSEIKANSVVHLHLVQRLIDFLIVYFIHNNITDFSDLID